MVISIVRLVFLYIKNACKEVDELSLQAFIITIFF